jgi:DNA polymerase Ligase (LigD)
MPRFAILEHDWPHPHRDLLLERDGVLKAWRLPADGSPDTPSEAVELPDHRLHYLDYEGPVSGDRGSVRRFDGGEVVWIVVEPDRCEVRLFGGEFRGVFVLTRRNGEDWQFSRA